MRNPGTSLASDLCGLYLGHTTHDNSDNMFAGIKEEEFGDDKRLDQHDGTGRNHREEGDYVHDSDKVEHDVTSAGQRLAEENHGGI